jgi:hypothetical protein
MKQHIRRRAAGAALAVATALATVGCTGDDGGAAQDDPEPTATPEPTAQAVPLTVGVGKVTGELARARRQRVAQGVAAAVDAWFEAAYLSGAYPRTSFNGAFPGFTPGARQRATRDQLMTTNAALGARTEEVTPRQKAVTVDLLSPAQRPAGATARFRLVFDTSGPMSYTVQVSGRLMLTRTPKGTWQVFGYDVARNAVPRQGGQS